MNKGDLYALLIELDHMPYEHRLRMEEYEPSKHIRAMMALYRAATVSDRAQWRMFVMDGRTSMNCSQAAATLVKRCASEIDKYDPALGEIIRAQGASNV